MFKCYSIFSTPVLIRHLWQLKTVVFLTWCLICAVLCCSITQPEVTQGYTTVNRSMACIIKLLRS